ncbi:MAG: transporter substrate-binding domain-containing protein [Coriobacteriales bacterium]|jgi:L-cystine transport system substrate-binding protein|nr:transporter substrate-binding domain-containing protein [Coriobacteriales bacterium]
MSTENDVRLKGISLSRRSFVVGGALAAGALAFGLTGCGGGEGGEGGTSNGTAAGGEAKDGVTKLRVGTGQAGGYPWFDVDEQGNSTGYEADILRKANELLPQYEFELQSIEMTTQLTELSNGTIDIGAHMYEDNQQRRENYLFSDVSIATMTQEFAVLKDNNEFKSFEDLVGKRIVTYASSNSAYALEQYNEENPDKPFEIIYAGAGDILASDLISGNADATLVDPLWLDYYTEAGLDLKIVTKVRFVETGVYYLFPKDGKHDQIKADLDVALKKLKDDGFIEELHQELFGYPAY